MKSIPVDDRRLTLTVAVPPRQRSKPDPFSGEITWDVDLFVVADQRAEVLRVGVAESGLSKHLAVGGAVQVEVLTARVWERQDGRHGVMFSCDSIRPTGQAVAAAKSTASGAAS